MRGTYSCFCSPSPPPFPHTLARGCEHRCAAWSQLKSVPLSHRAQVPTLCLSPHLSGPQVPASLLASQSSSTGPQSQPPPPTHAASGCLPKLPQVDLGAEEWRGSPVSELVTPPPSLIPFWHLNTLSLIFFFNPENFKRPVIAGRSFRPFLFV